MITVTAKILKELDYTGEIVSIPSPGAAINGVHSFCRTYEYYSLEEIKIASWFMNSNLIILCDGVFGDLRNPEPTGLETYVVRLFQVFAKNGDTIPDDFSDLLSPISIRRNRIREMNEKLLSSRLINFENFQQNDVAF